MSIPSPCSRPRLNKLTVPRSWRGRRGRSGARGGSGRRSGRAARAELLEPGGRGKAAHGLLDSGAAGLVVEEGLDVRPRGVESDGGRLGAVDEVGDRAARSSFDGHAGAEDGQLGQGAQGGQREGLGRHGDSDALEGHGIVGEEGGHADGAEQAGFVELQAGAVHVARLGGDLLQAVDLALAEEFGPSVVVGLDLGGGGSGETSSPLAVDKATTTTTRQHRETRVVLAARAIRDLRVFSCVFIFRCK